MVSQKIDSSNEVGRCIKHSTNMFALIMCQCIRWVNWPIRSSCFNVILNYTLFIVPILFFLSCFPRLLFYRSYFTLPVQKVSFLMTRHWQLLFSVRWSQFISQWKLRDLIPPYRMSKISLRTKNSNIFLIENILGIETNHVLLTVI